LEDLVTGVGETIEMSLLLLVSGKSTRINLGFFEALFGEKLVDARGVFRTFDLGLEWHLMLLRINGLPIDVGEERVLLQVFSVIIATNTPSGISLQKLLKEARCFLTEVWFHWDRFLGDVPKHLLTITVVMGWTAAEHLVEQGTQAPPVCSPRVTRTLDDLRSQILGSSAETVGLIRHFNALLRQTEISYSDMALSIQQDVLRLEISIDDVFLVECIDGTNDLGGVELSPLLIEPLISAEVSEELTAVQEIDKKVQLSFGLESIMQTNNIRVFDLLEDVALSLSLDEKILFDQLVLLQNLHGIRHSIVIFPHKIDLSE